MGVKDDYAGELPKAFVVLKSGVEANEKVGKELMAFVREKKIHPK
jgi:4-coumarate--CoA ligase